MLYNYLVEEMRKAGFEDEDKNFMYNNDKGVEFPDYLWDTLYRYSDEKIEFDLTSEEVFDSPGYTAYSIAVAVVYLDNPKVKVESFLFLASIC